MNLPDKEAILSHLEKGDQVRSVNAYLQADPANGGIRAFDQDNKEVTFKDLDFPKKQAVIKHLPARAEKKNRSVLKCKK